MHQHPTSSNFPLHRGQANRGTAPVPPTPFLLSSWGPWRTGCGLAAVTSRWNRNQRRPASPGLDFNQKRRGKKQVFNILKQHGEVKALFKSAVLHIPRTQPPRPITISTEKHDTEHDCVRSNKNNGAKNEMSCLFVLSLLSFHYSTELPDIDVHTGNKHICQPV